MPKAASAMAGPECGLRFAPIHRPLELLESHPRQAAFSHSPNHLFKVNPAQRCLPCSR